MPVKPNVNLAKSSSRHSIVPLGSTGEEHLKKAIEEGIADLQAGKVTDSKTIIDKLRKRVSADYRFSDKAERDLEDIIDYTLQQ